MPAIPAELTQRLRNTLNRCSPLDSDHALRAVFVDARLAPWRDRVPENTSDRAARVNLLIAALCDKTNARGDNALLLLLRVLAEHTPPDDALHNDLAQLAADIQTCTPADLAALAPSPSRPLSLSSTEARNRATMLQLVHNTWIAGVLEPSIHGAAMLELGKDYTPAAVDRPWDVELHLPGRETRPVPHGTPILDLFDRDAGAILILGDPGSGKTTTLLELARAAIARAQADPAAPIPVVFNLSSWAVKQPPLEDWLLEQLTTHYHIPKRTARPWIENDALLLLLDGLDEVKSEARDKCIVAINDFRQNHLVPLAVCSRTADYEALAGKLQLQTAITLRPLTSAQIDAYLAGAGIALHAVRATLQHDPVLQELAQSPLILSIMALAYSDLAPTNFQTLATPEARRQHLFDAYIERMFQRRAKNTPYTPEQTRRWLAWLAGQMTEHKQSVFLIENLLPNWLPDRECHRVHRLARLVVVGIIGLLFGLPLSLIGKSVLGLLVGMGVGLATGVFFVPAIWLGTPDTVHPVKTLVQLWQKLRKELCAWLAVWLVWGTIFGLVVGLVTEPGIGLGVGLVIWVVFGLVGGLVNSWTPLRSIETLTRSEQKLHAAPVVGSAVGLAIWWFIGLPLGLSIDLSAGPIDGLVVGVLFGLYSGLFAGAAAGLFFGLAGWLLRSWNTVQLAAPFTRFRQRLREGLVAGLVIGLVIWLTFGVYFGFNDLLFGDAFFDLSNWPVSGLLIGSAFGLFIGLVLGLTGGLVVGRVKLRTVPNQGICQLFKDTLAGGVAGGLVVGLFIGLAGGWDFWLIIGRTSVAVAGPILWLSFGGDAVLLHYILRVVLARTGRAPWNYARFLDACAERILLRKVGGGYIFIHRLLQEHFAAMSPAPPQTTNGE